MRLVTVYPSSRFFVSAHSGIDETHAAVCLNLRIRVDNEYDVALSFLDPGALRLLAVAVNTLLANYRRASPLERRRHRTCPTLVPVPLEIWPEVR